MTKVMEKASRSVADDDERRRQFEELYRRFAGDVFAFALRRLPRDAAQDVVADTFVVAWRRLEDVPATPLPWLLAVAHRTLATHRRSSRRREALVERIARERADEEREPVQDSPVLAALGRLTDREREALMLTAWEELTSDEAARVVGCSAVAFRLRLFRARRRLARELAVDDSHVGKLVELRREVGR